MQTYKGNGLVKAGGQRYIAMEILAGKSPLIEGLPWEGLLTKCGNGVLKNGLWFDLASQFNTGLTLIQWKYLSFR